MKVDTFEKFKNFVDDLNNKGFQGMFYLDEIVDNIFYWECNSNIKFEIIYDWYNEIPDFTIGCNVKYNDMVLNTHWHISKDKIDDELKKIQDIGIVCIIKINIFGKYSLSNIMYVNEYTDEVKSKYQDNFFNKYFEVFSKDK